MYASVLYLNFIEQSTNMMKIIEFKIIYYKKLVCNLSYKEFKALEFWL